MRNSLRCPRKRQSTDVWDGKGKTAMSLNKRKGGSGKGESMSLQIRFFIAETR